MRLLRRARLTDVATPTPDSCSPSTGSRLYPPQRAEPSEGEGLLEVTTLLRLRPDRHGEDRRPLPPWSSGGR